MDWILVFLATFVVGLQLFNHWNLSRGNLKLAYPLIIAIAVSNVIVDIYLTLIHPEQSGVLIYSIANLWAIIMAAKGIMRLKKEQKDHAGMGER